MKIINAKYCYIHYPVGENIQDNIRNIKGMGSQIKSILSKDIYMTERINLICTGSSGAIIASIISLLLIKKYPYPKIYYVRKIGEIAHRSGVYNFPLDGYNIIVDDLISSGETIKRIFGSLHKKTKINLIAVGKIEDEKIISYLKKKKVEALLYCKE